MAKIFVSYSWDDEPHRSWVFKLVERLRNDGIEVIFDKSHLKPGDQLTSFMENSITISDYILIVCTPTYKVKSNERTRGVGYEGNIMTAELFRKGNQRKFIPILAKGNADNAVPTWLIGKLYLDMTSSTSIEEQYPFLLSTLKSDEKELKHSSSKANLPTNNSTINNSSQNTQFKPIKIVSVMVNEITTPKLDGTRGSGLYAIPFKLSIKPPLIWSDIFVQTWNHPPSFSTMHRPGIARVYSDRIILDGTTIEEVKKIHKETLELCVKEANEEYQRFLDKERVRKDFEEKRLKKHKEGILEKAKDINFD